MRFPMLMLVICTIYSHMPAQDAAAVYAQWCAGCHGAQMEGGLSDPLIKEDWTYGRRKGDIIRNITYGISGTEMIAWNTVLDQHQIRGLADYIYQAQHQPPDRIRPLPDHVQVDGLQISIDTWISDLETPWALEFVNADLAYISERKGNLHEIHQGNINLTPVAGTPPTHLQSSTGGYMDLALDPDFDANGWIYLALSHVGTGASISDRMAPALTKIIRGRVQQNTWIDEETLFQVPDSLLVVRGNRWGCRLLFDRQGRLLFTIGDMGKADDSQMLDKATGKIFRINPDGSVPRENPYVGIDQALPQIFSIGNRNVQGLAQHPTTGEIWATEHGPMGGDELNIIEPGKNYGWPRATLGVDYTGAIVSDKKSLPGMIDPIYHWTPSNGICPLTFVESPSFKGWQNHLIAGALAYEELILLKIDDHRIVSEEKILRGYGRVRDVKFGPDGALYVVLNKPDKIIRLRAN